MKETKYTVKYTTSFKKDYKRAIKRGLKIEVLEQVVALLAMGEPLPDKNRDHDLCRAFPFGWQLAPDGQRESYQCPAACSCGGQCAPVYRQIPAPDWCRPPTLPAKSPHFLYRSSRSYPLCDFSNRLSHPGYAVHSRPGRMPCGTLRPTVHFLSEAGASA